MQQVSGLRHFVRSGTLDVRPGCFIGKDTLAPRLLQGGKLQVGVSLVLTKLDEATFDATLESSTICPETRRA